MIKLAAGVVPDAYGQSFSFVDLLAWLDQIGKYLSRQDGFLSKTLGCSANVSIKLHICFNIVNNKIKIFMIILYNTNIIELYLLFY